MQFRITDIYVLILQCGIFISLVTMNNEMPPDISDLRYFIVFFLSITFWWLMCVSMVSRAQIVEPWRRVITIGITINLGFAGPGIFAFGIIPAALNNVVIVVVLCVLAPVLTLLARWLCLWAVETRTVENRILV